MKTKLSRLLQTVLLLIAVIACDHDTSAQQPPPAPVAVAEVVRMDVSAGQAFVATVTPLKRAVVGSAVDGRVVELVVHEGERVAEGGPLAKLLTATIELELAAAEAELDVRNQELAELEAGSRINEIEQAKAKMLGAKADMEFGNSRLIRSQQLRTSNSASREEFDQVKAQASQSEQVYAELKAAYDLMVEGPRPERIAQARAQVAYQQAMADRIKDRIKKYTITSRFDGYVVAEHVDEGTWLKSGDPVMELVALDEVEVYAYVVEQYAAYIKPGTTVRVDVPALPKELFTGVITTVIPQADSKSRTFPVKIRVKNTITDDGPLLKAGMYARVELPIGPQQSAVMVPKNALVLGGPQPVVYVVDGSEGDSRSVRPVAIDVGVAMPNLIQAKGALEPGQLVVVEGNERLRPGQSVVISSVVKPAATPVSVDPIGGALTMALIEAFVKNPVKVSVAVLLVSLFGVVALTRMPMQLTPEVQIPTITVQTTWPGASPQEVEQEITMEQEEQLKSVEGVTKMTSESADSKSTITLEFIVGTNMEEALLKVNSRLQQVPEYPEDSDEPVITTANASDRPIAWFILSTRRPTDDQFAAFEIEHPELAEILAPARHAHNVGLVMLRLRMLAKDHPEVKQLLPPDDLEVTQLRRFAEDEIEARFERVPGVSQSNVIGGLEDELQVIVDPEKLAARQLTMADVRNVLQGQNKDTSAGDFWEGKRRWVVRAMGQFRSPEQVEQQLLSVTNGAPVFVRDVATVELGYKKPDGLVRRFGESSIAINCLRETDANVLDVMDGLRAANRDIDENILRARGLQLTQVYDETEYIYSSIELVQQNIFIGGALTMIVLMLFLHLGVRTILTIPLIVASSLAAAYLSPLFFLLCIAIILVAGFWFARGALVVALAIPTSIIASFLVLGVLGRSLNVISLAGLAFAVGMLVDNAVVVLENIYRHFKSGDSPVSAAVRGTQEVWGAIAASTITTVAVFLPIVFVQEEAGQLFRDIALAISAAVALSLVISMSVIPTAASRLFHSQPNPDGEPSRPASQGAHQHTNRITQFVLWPINTFGETFVRTTVGVNDWIQRGTVRRIAVSMTLVVMALGISWSFWPKVEYLPTGNRNLVFGILLPPPGYNLDQLTEAGKTVETALRPYWDVDPESAEAAALDFPAIGDFFFVARGRQVFMGIRAHDGQRAGELVPLVQQVGSKMPGTFAVAKQSSLFEQGLTGGRTIEIEITGPDLNKLVALGGQTIGKVKQIMPSAQARPIPSLDLSSPEIHITPKLVQAAEMGVSSRDLGFSANCLIDGAYAGDYYLDGKKIDLTIVGESHYADTTQEIEALPIATPGGQLIPLAALADVELASGPEQVNHRERVRAITIEVSPPPEIALEDAMAQIRSEIVQPLIDSGQLGGGYQVNLAGTADKLSKMQTTFLGQWSGWNLDSLLSVLTSQFVLVVLITYLLMAALFESWLYPMVIILTVPLGAVGGILGLNLLNVYLAMTGQLTQQLDILTMLGFVILIGTVVNNPILIVHQSLNHMREDGMSPRRAILQSVRTRIRPIFMTTLTTVLGLFPLVLFPGPGSELYRGLGSVVLGGLLVSTIFTLVLVPTLFSLLLEAKAGLIRRIFGNRREPAFAAELPTRQRGVQLDQPEEPNQHDSQASSDVPKTATAQQPAASVSASLDDR